ncbi:MAG: PAS domain S-box protein [Planctomycetes bacterium]|nr:PAS domain S-box protein [Planctomycetota bacterium]
MRSLRARLLLLTAALAAGLLALAVVATSQASADHARGVAERGGNLAHALAEQLDLWLAQPLHGLQEVATELAELPADGDPHQPLRDGLRYHSQLAGLQLVDGDGRVLAVAPRQAAALGLDASAQPWYQAARLAPGPQWSPVQRQSDGRLGVMVSLRLADGRVLGARIDLSRLAAMVRLSHPDPHGFVAVIDRQGTVLAHNSSDERFQGDDLAILAASGARASWQGRPGIASQARVEACGWSVAVFQDRATAFAAVDRLVLVLGLGLGGGGLLAAALLWYAIGRLLVPVRELAVQAARLAEGRRGEPVSARYREFAPAADAFAAMAAAVAAREDELRRSQAEYRDLVENAGVAILRLGRDGRILFANGHAGRLFGWEPVALAGQAMVGSVLPEVDRDGRAIAPRLAAVLADPLRHPRGEGEAVTRDGRRLVMAWANRPLADDQGGVLTVGIDVTEQRRGEEAIRTLLRSAAGATGDEFFAVAAAALADWSGATVATLWEVSDGRGEALAAHGPDGPLPPCCRALAGTPCARTAAEGFLHLPSGTGASFPGLGPLAGHQIDGYAGIAVHGRDGTVVGLICLYSSRPLPLPPLGRAVLEIVASRVAAEIARRRADHSQRRSEEVFRLFMEHLPGAAYILDMQGRALFCNCRGEGGQVDHRLVHRLAERLGPAAAPSESVEHLGLEGREQWFRTIRFPIAQPDGQVLQAGIALDITDSRQALHERELFFDLPLSLLVAAAPDGTVRRANPGWLAILGWEPGALAGLALSGLVDPDDHDALARALADLAAGRRVAGLELRLRRRAGGCAMVAWEASPLAGGHGFLAIGHDVSARREAEGRLRQVEKLDALGQLAGGVAHDFNNQLGGILGHCELALRLPLGEDAHRHLAAIQTAAQRSARLTGQILAFARKGNYRVEVIDLDALVDEVETLLERSLDKRIALVRHRSPVPPLVAGDAGALQNAILNLALNARDAMPQGGTLSFAIAAAELPDGPAVELAVADTGTGIAPEVQRRIFEPFFTTKAQGKGTGLGLSAVYGTVTAHHGTIAVASTPGHGTTFRLRLPAAPAGLATPDKPPPPATAPASLRVLLVEDEPHLRELGCEMLGDLGHHATACADGVEAEAVFAADPAAFDLVMLDMMMPHRGGAETFAVLRALRPDLRVLVSSGFSQEHETRTLLSQGVRGVLPKPYGFEELARAIAAAMA